MTVIDSSDADWWKGKCLGKIGFFPSKYVAKLAPNEKPLQVTHNLQISETEEGLNKLLRDQVQSNNDSILVESSGRLINQSMITNGNQCGICMKYDSLV